MGQNTAPWLHASHQVCHTSPGVPAAQDHCLSGQAGLSSSAALQPWRGAPASGYHQGLDACRVMCQQPSTSQGAPWFYLFLLMSARPQTPLSTAWGGPPAPPVPLQVLCWLGHRAVVNRSGVNLGEAGKGMASGCCRQWCSLPGASPPASPPTAVLQGLFTTVSTSGGKVGGDSELPLPTCLCQLSSCPADDPCGALVSAFPLQQVLEGGQSPPLGFCRESGVDVSQPQPGQGVIWCGWGWPAAGQAREAAGYPAPQRSPGNRGMGGGDGGGRKGVKFPQLKCNHRYRFAPCASPLLAHSPCTHRRGSSAK